jgi:glycosyltransferase involved in cell wall biosynthesis
MKLVVFSNLYPPLFVGGYEIGAARVVRELKQRGHDVLVLSSHEYFWQLERGGFLHREHAAADKADIVDTGLCVFGSLLGFLKRKQFRAARKLTATLLARRRCNRAIRDFRPDAFLVFNPLGVLAPLLNDFVAHARTTGAPVHAYVSDQWLTSWPSSNPIWPALSRFSDSPHRVSRFFGRTIGRLLDAAAWLPDPLLRLDRYLYCSDFIKLAARLGLLERVRRAIGRENNLAVAEQAVVHWGLPEVGRLPLLPADHFDHDKPLTLLFAGQLIEHKGLHVLLGALARCRRPHRLVVLGDDQTEYAASCKQLAAQLGVLERVHFAGKKPNAEMPNLLNREGHVLIVPSVLDEPFSIVILEGMSVGLPVIASDTGGTAEAVVDGETGFLFPRGDARELAAVINRLEADRPLCRRVGARARLTVRQRFTIEGMVDQMLTHFRGSSDQVVRTAA